jgi:predicted Zn-dependent protease
VQGIGNRLAQRAKRRNEVKYQFYVVESPDVNAFAIPGGGVFLTTEALKYMRNEAELAAVIGHEIGHVDENHGTESIKRAMLLQNVAEGALSSNDPQVVKLLASIVLDLTLKGFSREQEREADRVGVELAVAQSYAPSGLTGFLNTLLQLSGGDPDGLWAFVATHPGSAERIGLLNAYIREKGLQPANPILNEAQYLRQIAVLPPKLKKGK